VRGSATRALGLALLGASVFALGACAGAPRRPDDGVEGRATEPVHDGARGAAGERAGGRLAGEGAAERAGGRLAGEGAAERGEGDARPEAAGAGGASADAGEGSAPRAAPSTRRVTVGASGDVLVHLKVARSAREHAAEGGFGHVFGELGEVVGEDEVAFVNLETPLSDRVPAETGEPPVLGAPAAVAAALGAAGIDVVSVANNHSYDQTAAGLADTLRALDGAGVRAAGASAEDGEAPGPVIVERGGLRVAFVAFTERVNRGPVARGAYTRVARFDEETAGVALARARERADVVVLSIHWSHDFVDQPLLAQRERARALVEAGADLIVGHGAHVLQEVERLESARGEAVVAYSLGNLVSNQGLRYFAGRRIPERLHPAVVLPTVRDGVWLRTTFALEDGRVRVESIEGVPLWTRNNFLAVARREADRLDIRVRPLSRVDEPLRSERRAAIAEALGGAVTLAE
jgi:poly-gamma-glutamate synthesis protein (capsule biosynthesis protein)